MSGGLGCFYRMTAVVLIASTLSACSSKNIDNIEVFTEQDQTEITDPALDMSYEVPVVTPGILIDQYGYELTSEKIVIFRGEDIEEHFEVRDLETDEVVYSGEIRRSKYNEELGEYDSCGYFTDLQTEGRYYIYNDTLGSSYAFSIGENIYTDLFNSAGKIYYLNRCGYSLTEQFAGENARSACHTNEAYFEEDDSTEIDITGGWHLDEKADRDVVEGCKIANNLLLAYELNSDVFLDDTDISESGDGIADILNEVKYEVDWMLKMQDSKTGGVYASALTQQSSTTDLSNAAVKVTPITMEATIAFAGLLAKFGYLYQNVDSSYATDCLRAADRAWKCYLKNVEAGEDSLCFLAAAELFRATGSSSYSEILKTYFEDEAFTEKFISDEAMFFGGVTYISTTQDVDRKVCEKIMGALMENSEEIATRSNSSTFFVTECVGDDLLDTIFDDMRCLTVTNHIIYNHEYTTIIENHAHFLLGSNPNAINYVTDNTENSYALYENEASILSNPVYVAEFIVMMSVIQ